jgi:hypothetical protein
MTTPVLLETYLRQIREVARGVDKKGQIIMEGPAEGLARRAQIVKLADLALIALETMRDGIVTVKRPPTASSSAETEPDGSSAADQDGPRG